jgi:class 3 adenylate cyclase/FixJ family two-component response regulator
MEGRVSILIVDDEPRVLDSLEALLAMEYRVLRADEPKAALSALAEAEVAVIVSDQRMPGMSGVEFLTRSRRVAPDTVRILLTAFTDADALMTSINGASVYRFLLKPWDPGELLHTVRRGVEHYELARDRARLLGDLSSRNAELEAALGHLRAAQDGLVREASLRAQLERYVSPRLVEAAVANPELLDLPGDWREATVLFADIRGFTRLIERTPPAVVIRLLDEYFEAMVGIVFQHEGTVEQLIGDEIVALFGVHEGEAGAADRAVQAALEMAAAVERLTARWKAAGLPTFDIGVGLASGRLMAGTIGSGRRRELIVVGRPMIAAARIQRMTRLFGVRIIASEETFHHVSDRVLSRELGRPKLKGLAHRAALYEIQGRVPSLAGDGR